MQKEKQRKIKKCQEYCPQALGWDVVTSQEPQPPRVPRLNCGAADGAADEVPANEPLLGLTILIQVGPPTPQSSRIHPKDRGPLCRKNF